MPKSALFDVGPKQHVQQLQQGVDQAVLALPQFPPIAHKSLRPYPFTYVLHPLAPVHSRDRHLYTPAEHIVYWQPGAVVIIFDA